MTVIESLVKASAAFVRIAPAAIPAEPSAELTAAFRRYRYWYLRRNGVTAADAAKWAGEDADKLRGGNVPEILWDRYRAVARHWSERPARIRAAEYAAKVLAALRPLRTSTLPPPPADGGGTDPLENRQ